MLANNAQVSTSDFNPEPGGGGAVEWSNTKSWMFLGNKKNGLRGDFDVQANTVSYSWWAMYTYNTTKRTYSWKITRKDNHIQANTLISIEHWNQDIKARGRSSSGQSISQTLYKMLNSDWQSWNHYCLTVDASSSPWTFKFYINGSLKHSKTQNLDVGFKTHSSGYSLLIGNYRYDQWNPQNLLAIDEFGLFNTVLSQNAIQDIYNLGVPHNLKTNGPAGNYTQTGNLVNYYRFGDGTGDNPYTTDAGSTPFLNDEQGSRDLDYTFIPDGIIEGSPP